ncbi:retrovirus-related pol polyprotein from transposon TNT 1-94 [Tanacetum coccineum]
MELMEKRRKHFAALRAQEKRNRPPTKAQKRTQMSTYLKHMGGYTYKQLKGKSFDEIQKLFDKEMKRVNTFVAMGSEVQESKEKKVEGSEETAKSSRKKMLGRKRAGKEQQQESLKKQKVEKEKESDEVDEAELKKLLVIKKDEDIAIDAIPLATKLPGNCDAENGVRTETHLQFYIVEIRIEAVTNKAKSPGIVGRGSEDVMGRFRYEKKCLSGEAINVTFIIGEHLKVALRNLLRSATDFKVALRSHYRRVKWYKDPADSPGAPVRYSPSANYLLLTDNGELESYSEALIRISAGKKALQRLWMFKVKEEQNDRKRYKARFVVKGFQQKQRLDYNEIFSPVVKMTTISWAGRKPRVQIEGNSIQIDSSTETMVDDMLVVGSDMAEFNKPKWQLPLVFEMKDIYYEKQVLGYVLTFGVTIVKWESRLQKSIIMVLIFVEDSWNEEPCRDVHQVGDEREVEVLHIFKWPPGELIMEDGVLPEFIPSLMMLVQDTLYRKSPSPVFAPQIWISQVARAKEPRTLFDELMDTSFNFSAFVLNWLNIKDLTQEILVGPEFELLKGTCKSLTELEYHLEECSKATTERIDWHNPEGKQYPFDLSKPLLLIRDH